MQRAADMQLALTKERRELRDQQQMQQVRAASSPVIHSVDSSAQLEAAPRDLGRQWEDPLAQGGERVFASELKNLHTQARQPAAPVRCTRCSWMLCSTLWRT